MGHIFISYSRQDRDVVDSIITKLEEAGLDIWVDRDDIKAGRQWRMQIVRAIDAADSFVISLSPNSITSVNVRKELDLAEDSQNPFVLPVMLADVTIPPEMRYQLAGTQHIPYYLDPEEGYDKLEGSLLDRQIELGQKSDQPPSQLEVEIVIKGEALANFDDKLRDKLLAFLSEATGASIDELIISRVEAGSVHVFVQMPSDSGYALKAMALNDDSRLQDAGITGLRFVGDKKIIPISQGPLTSVPREKSRSRISKKLMQGIGAAISVSTVVIAIAYFAGTFSSIFPSANSITGTPTKLASVATETGLPDMDTLAPPTTTNTPTNASTLIITPTATNTPSATSTPTGTPTPEPPMAVAKRSSLCRAGPGLVYPISGGDMVKGEAAPIIGVSKDGWWLLVKLEKYKPPINCWVSTGENGTADSTGDLGRVPVIAPPPTPTPTSIRYTPPSTTSTYTPTPFSTSTNTSITPFPTPTDTPIPPTPTATPDTIPPPIPNQLEPINGVDLGCVGSAMLRWKAVSDPSGITEYQIEVQRHPGDDNWQAVSGSLFTGIDGTEKEISLECGWEYRWRVRAIDNQSNVGNWSGWFTFIVTLT